MKRAHYHHSDGTSTILEIVEQHSNGSVTLAHDGEVVVAGCPVSQDAKPGFCTPVVEQVELPENPALKKLEDESRGLREECERLKGLGEKHFEANKKLSSENKVLAKEVEAQKVRADKASDDLAAAEKLLTAEAKKVGDAAEQK